MNRKIDRSALKKAAETLKDLIPHGLGMGQVFAAAPELLEACKAMKEILEQSDTRHYIGHDLGDYSKLHDAIHKANRAIQHAQEAK